MLYYLDISDIKQKSVARFQKCCNILPFIHSRPSYCNNLIAFVHDLLTMITIISNMSDQFYYSTIYRKLNCQDSLSLYFIMDINKRKALQLAHIDYSPIVL